MVAQVEVEQYHLHIGGADADGQEVADRLRGAPHLQVAHWPQPGGHPVQQHLVVIDYTERNYPGHRSSTHVPWPISLSTELDPPPPPSAP